METRKRIAGRSRTSAVALLMLMLGAASAASAEVRPPGVRSMRVNPPADAIEPTAITEATVRAMLDALIELIFERHHPTRHWEPVRPPSGQSPQPTGRTALAVLALLDAGIPARSPRVAAAIDWMAATPADGTYAIAARLMVWCRLPDFERERRHECGRLLERFSAEGGGWDYGPSPRPGFIDQSLTQFGLQAITEAVRRGVSIPSALFDRVRTRFLATQNPDGGWGYRRRGDPSRGSMTAAGVASLALIEAQVRSTRKDRRKSLDAMRMAMAWLEIRFDAEANPGCSRWHLYWIHALERAARVTGLRRLGTRDWFEESAAMIRRRLFLVEPRNPPRVRGDPRIDRIAFALLVLRRGLEPVAFACLDVGGGPPIDDLLGDACDLVSEHLERPTGWVRVGMEDPPRSWRRFPVLVVRSPSDAAWLDAPESAIARRLSTFVAHGGIVIALPDATGPGTRTFPQRAIAAIVPTAGHVKPDSIHRTDPARIRVGRWRIDAHQIGSKLRRWCIAVRTPLRPGALAERIETEIAAMLASICLERSEGRLPSRTLAASGPPSPTPARTQADAPASERSIRRIDWPGAGLAEPMLLPAWDAFDHRSPPGRARPSRDVPKSRCRRLVWLSGVGDADPADLGDPASVFDPEREFLVAEALSPAFQTRFTAWIRARGWRVGLPPAGAPSSCTGLHDDERCVGVLIDDRPARRLLGIRTPPDFTFDDLDALHRSIETASVIDRATMPLDPDEESSRSIDERGSTESDEPNASPADAASSRSA